MYYAYLIQLDKPLGSPRHRASLYLGIARDWLARFHQHCTGHGAKMLKVAVERGIQLTIVRLWQFPTYSAAKAFEDWAKRSLKNHQRLLRMNGSTLTALFALV